jgi:putative membrane protein
MSLHKWNPVVLILVAALAVGSCGKKQEETTAENTPPPPAATPLSDANIAAIIVAANDADIKNGEVAQSASSNADVKAFAKQMIADHNSANQKAKDLASKLGMKPEENTTSTQLTSQADAARDALKAKKGPEFDRAYVDNEVKTHQDVLDMIDNQLLPNAQNAELKGLIEAVRPVIAQHLDHAKQLQMVVMR